MNATRPVLLLNLSLLLAGCSAGPSPQSPPSTKENTEAAPANPAPVFLGTLWVQTAAEYGGLAEQAYSAAGERLEQALAESSWTAALEQEGTDFTDLPPAIVLDVDETVLDNSPFEARLALENRGYSAELWAEWVRLEQAEPLPGAKEFLLHAHEQGVTIFYVTNRDSELEEATRANLEKEGLPLDESQVPDVVLTKGENDWGSDKITRRRAVAKTHRILLLFGDDLNDFVSGARAQEPGPRVKLAAEHAERWGRKWILLPNPLYGSWEASLYGRDYSLSDEEKLRRAGQYLRPPSP